MVASHVGETQAVLGAQAQALRGRDRAGYLASWAAGRPTQRLAGRTYDNLVELGVDSIAPRLSLPSLRDRPAGWAAAVDVCWRLDGFDRADATSALRYTFSDQHGEPVITGLEPIARGREPIWLLPGLQVIRGRRTLVATTSSGSAARVDRLLRAAVTAVSGVLPRWHGGLVAYVPATADQFGALIAATPGQYRGIAAVTASVDGSQQRSAPAAIVVNPQVFAGIGPIGAHVVITHEATHVATGAAAGSMPLWLAEGFADYVGIGSVRLPLSVAAKAALRVVRRNGAPVTLPSDSEFALDQGGLEATYEEAWLATSLIARTYGQHRLVALYRTVEAHPDDLAGAFTRILHTSVPAFTSSWHGYLEEAAGGR